MKNFFWGAVLIVAVVTELVFFIADPAGAGTDVGTPAGLAGVGAAVAMVAVLGRGASVACSSNEWGQRLRVDRKGGNHEVGSVRENGRSRNEERAPHSRWT
jgi:hypothetical protein